MYSLIASLILISIVLTARIASKWRLPLVVIALSIGILFGSDVLGLIYFNNPKMAKTLADFALVFVLFIGGFGTKKETLQTVLHPSMTLASLGVILTAVITASVLYLFFDFSFKYTLLLGCIISSTDAAAVFSILRSRPLNPKLTSLLEIESATNDPMAIVLTTVAIQLITANVEHPFQVGVFLLWQFFGGIGIGLLIGKIGVLIFQRVKVLDRGYFYIFLISIILLSFGAADVVKASGMISAFFAGFLMGNSGIPYKKTLESFLDALQTIANVIIFVILGLLVFPSEFGTVWKEGLVLFLVLSFLARPVTVLICTVFDKFKSGEKVLLSWCGLRGSVPIVLATYPAAANIEGSREIFNIIFFAVALSMLVQGNTISLIASWLKLTVKPKPKPTQAMELVTLHSSDLELCEIAIDEDDYEGSTFISALHLPKGTTVTMINRHDRIIAPQGSTEVFPGDILYVLVNSKNIERVTSRILGKFTAKENT